MPFESLTFRWNLELPGVPYRWLPLIHPYDPDLPLFPVYYFHTAVSPVPGRRPSLADRVFGYVERLSVADGARLSCTLVTNKNLAAPENERFRDAAEAAALERLGGRDPVRRPDLAGAFQPPHQATNRLLEELWERVVVNAYGDALPFGRLWDEVLGVARFVASFRSQSGRKGELIQTHYFASRFGERIQSGGDVPQLDFYLLPSADELVDTQNPLVAFPRFKQLLDASRAFCQAYGYIVQVGGGQSLYGFRSPGKLSNESLLAMAGTIPARHRDPFFEAFNAMGKGAHRTVILLLMLHNLRTGHLRPDALGPAEIGSLYSTLRGSYLAPKVVSIYVQQCWANPHALPVDLWVEAFLKWPANVWPVRKEAGREPLDTVLRASRNLGKVERLIWVAAQARKVHSSACDDALWCLKKSSDSDARGANPLACGICAPQIRGVCPAYAAIADKTVALNRHRTRESFGVHTSARNNTDPAQVFVNAEGLSIYEQIFDDFSPTDDPNGLNGFPDRVPHPDSLTVSEFVERYGR